MHFAGAISSDKAKYNYSNLLGLRHSGISYFALYYFYHRDLPMVCWRIESQDLFWMGQSIYVFGRNPSHQTRLWLRYFKVTINIKMCQGLNYDWTAMSETTHDSQFHWSSAFLKTRICKRHRIIYDHQTLCWNNCCKQSVIHRWFFLTVIVRVLSQLMEVDTTAIRKTGKTYQ